MSLNIFVSMSKIPARTGCKSWVNSRLCSNCSNLQSELFKRKQAGNLQPWARRITSAKSCDLCNLILQEFRRLHGGNFSELNGQDEVDGDMIRLYLVHCIGFDCGPEWKK